MDQLRSHKTKILALTHSINAHNYVVQITKVLVSLSLFSIIIPPSSLLSFLHHFNFYFSTFSLQLFTHTIDKNCMFLLCNGLLVFVGVTRSLSGYSGVDETSKYAENGSQSQYADVEANELMLVEEKTIELDEQNREELQEAIEIKYSGKEVEEEDIEDIVLEDEEEKGSGLTVSKEEEEPDDETGLFDTQEEEEEEIDEFQVGENVEEEENWVLSTEELNKKFDEFIRRMKENLRIEARRRLVMV